MKAVVHHKYGSPDRLKVEEVPEPVITDETVLVRVHAVSLNPFDWHFLRGEPRFMRMQSGFFKPKKTIPGVDIAGVVIEVGATVKDFKIGDRVFGMGVSGCAEVVRINPTRISAIPESVSCSQAASLPIAALTALQGLRDKGRLIAGEKVLINGAAGGVGTFAVQIASLLGAEVSAVCSSKNTEAMRSLGAVHVIDYSKENFVRGREKYDLILDIVGSRSLFTMKRILTPNGRIVLVGGKSGKWIAPALRIMGASLISKFFKQNFDGMMTEYSKKDLQYLIELVQTGKISPLISQTPVLADVPKAMAELEAGHVLGKIVINL